MNSMFVLYMTKKRSCWRKALVSQKFSYMLVALLVISEPVLRGGEPVPEVKGNGFTGICSPIVTLPQSRRAMIDRKFFPEMDYEVAILPSFGLVGVEYYSTYLIRRDEQGFKCCIKRIDPRQLIENGEFSPRSLEESELEVRSSGIDAASVQVLSEFLRTGVSQAVYHSKDVIRSHMALDGVSFDVYVKGRREDAYPAYSGSVTDQPYNNGSRSCSTIVFALSALVLGGDDEPLQKLVAYLRAFAQGEAIPPDPFLRPAAPAPDLEPLPN